jgi:hypothetical protein
VRGGRLSDPRAWFAGALLVALMVLAPRTQAQAEAARVHLHWVRPPNSMCPAGATVQRDVEEQLEQRVFVPESEAEVLVRGRVHDQATGVRVLVEVRDAGGALLGKRELTAKAGECASLRSPLAFLLGMLLESEGMRLAERRRRTSSLRAGASVGLLSGVLPRTSPGLGLRFAVDPTHALRLRVDASYWLPVVLETPSGVGAKLQSLGLELLACPRLGRSTERLDWWICGGVRAASLHGAPRKLSGAERQLRVLGQGVLELALSVRLSPRSSLELGAGLLTSFTRPEVTYVRSDRSVARVHRVARFGAILRLGLTIGAR